MKEIKLTQGKIAIVDDEDFEYLNQWKWYADKIGDTYYAKRREYPSKKMLYMHRVILMAATGNVVDHKNRNGLDNQKNNLRQCSRSQNMWNQKAQKNGKSGFLGVSFDKSRCKWVAQICTNYKIKYIGRFDTPEEAAVAYNVKAKELHGEFTPI